MNQKQLIAEMAVKAGVTEKVAAAVLKAFVGAVAKSMDDGLRVSVAGLGVFKRRLVKARAGVNPRNGRPVVIPAKKAVRLQIAPSLKDFIN